jgi:hypothetical protein
MSAVLQALHIIEAGPVIASQPAFKLPGYDCNDFREVVRPAR